MVTLADHFQSLNKFFEIKQPIVVGVHQAEKPFNLGNEFVAMVDFISFKQTDLPALFDWSQPTSTNIDVGSRRSRSLFCKAQSKEEMGQDAQEGCKTEKHQN